MVARSPAWLRGLSETPFHLAGACPDHPDSGLPDRRDDLYATLTDFRFLKKAANVVVVEHTATDGRVTRTYTGVYALLDDYALALPKFRADSSDAARTRVAAAIRGALGLSAPLLAQAPGQLPVSSSGDCWPPKSPLSGAS